MNLGNLNISNKLIIIAPSINCITNVLVIKINLTISSYSTINNNNNKYNYFNTQFIKNKMYIF